MAEEFDEKDIKAIAYDDSAMVEQEEEQGADENRFSKFTADASGSRYKLTGMYQDWFLDYASYVILDRAVPHITDGLKPVQRRILHAMKMIDDGRYNKVANIIGQTMQYHPHGDASIGDALVQLGQKELLIDCQGNWGNILTGDDAAAPRYIEARLSKFALDVVFNPKTTEWVPSYDGRNQEPVNLPVKFPLLLAQGAEGIAVGLASKILPHNFNELIDAAISYLRGEEFELYPDFPTGGLMDCSRYNRGLRGGSIRVRSRISKIDKKTIAITEIPYGKSTSTIIESIIKASEKGKIKIKRVDDNTAQSAEIVITLPNDVSPDKTIDALYAFTDCEVSISPNSCVIMEKHPHFMGVDRILKYNADYTKHLLQTELNIRLGELENDWHWFSLEKIFFENKVYRLLENDSKSWEYQLEEIFTKMLYYQKLLHRPITMDDINKLVEKPVRKISKFDVKEVEEKILKVEKEIEKIKRDLSDMVAFTIKYYKGLKEKYGERFPRNTEICSFENIEATKVAASNAKLYVNRAEGFVGMDLKKDESAEFVCDCSDIDDVIVFTKDGKFKVSKIKDKEFFGKNIIHADVYVKNDNRTIYNVIYRDGKVGNSYVKRFTVPAITKDKEYDITAGSPDSQVLWFTANHNGEAEIVKVFLRPNPKVKKLLLEYNFAELSIKGRAARGNTLTKHSVHKIQLKTKGVSTLGGKRLWFDTDVNRLNDQGHGILLGEFHGGDQILAVFKDGTYYTTNYDLSNKYQGDIQFICKFNDSKCYSALYLDGESGFIYLKRFSFEKSDNMPQPFISTAKGSALLEIVGYGEPKVEIIFGGRHEGRPSEIVDAIDFIAQKSFRAKGKRLSYFDIGKASFVPVEESEDDLGEATELDEDAVMDDTPAETGDNAADFTKPENMVGKDDSGNLDVNKVDAESVEKVALFDMGDVIFDDDSQPTLF